MSREAPERIYLQYDNGEDLPVTWASDSIYDSDVAYIRADKYTELEEKVKVAVEGLDEIKAIEYHNHGMGCGLEDMGIIDRYDAMAYGWEDHEKNVNEIVEKTLKELKGINNE